MTGAELRALRASLDLSQQSLADRIGVASNTVARWERDENPIPAHVAMAVEHLTCKGYALK